MLMEKHIKAYGWLSMSDASVVVCIGMTRGVFNGRGLTDKFKNQATPLWTKKWRRMKQERGKGRMGIHRRGMPEL